jgi:hypothetical protein
MYVYIHYHLKKSSLSSAEKNFFVECWAIEVEFLLSVFLFDTRQKKLFCRLPEKTLSKELDFGSSRILIEKMKLLQEMQKKLKALRFLR